MNVFLKKMTAVVLLSALCITSGMFCYAGEAETEAEEIDTANAVYLECALDSTAEMVSQAILGNVSCSGREALWDFRTVAFASPEMAIIIFPDSEQMEQLHDSLNAEGTQIAFAIADMANIQWSSEYAELAPLIRISREQKRTLPETGCGIVVLFYEQHISLTCMDNESLSTEFIMSDKTVTSSVNEEYIPGIAQDLAVEGSIEQVIYSKEQLSAIYGKDNTQSVSFAMNAMAASDATMLQMVPGALSSPTYGKNTSVTIERIAASYVRLRESNGESVFAALGDARSLSEQIMSEVDEEWSWRGIDLEADDFPDLTEIDLSVDFPKDKTILVVSRVEDEDLPKINYSFESVLPQANIPASAADADLILLVDSKWEYQSTQNDIDVYACKTVLSLHDAAAGELLGIVGSSFNTLSGFVMVSGSTYKPKINNADIKDVLLAWINAAE